MEQVLTKFLSFAGLEETSAPGVLLSASDTGPRFGSAAQACLIVDWQSSLRHRQLLREMSGGAIDDVAPVSKNSSRLSWHQAAEDLSPHLAGWDIECDLPPQQFVTFVTTGKPAADMKVLASIDGQPWLVCLQYRTVTIYLIGVSDLPDLDSRVATEADETSLLSIAVPILLFLRKYYPDRTWQPRGAWANFIIDDPWLKPRYGFLKHGTLARLVNDLGAAATIAFIPWNAKRSKAAVVDLYKRTERLSLCVHGFEHTNAEFAETDRRDVVARATNAIELMQLHQRLTGLSYEPVMVFPQGVFSIEGLEALQSGRFLAAINSHSLAINHRHLLCFRDLLEPAVSGYGTVPLFLRRYPKDVELCRYDQALGRPLFLVEHHQYFRDEGADFGRTVAAINKIRPDVAWQSTGTIVRELHCSRAENGDHRQVRFYSDEFVYRNAKPGRTWCDFEKAERSPELVTQVLVNGRTADLQRSGAKITFGLELPPFGIVDVSVRRELHRAAELAFPPTISHRARVAARRYLSDFRDDYVQTSNVLNACHAALRRAIGNR